MFGRGEFGSARGVVLGQGGEVWQDGGADDRGDGLNSVGRRGDVNGQWR